MPTGIYIRKPLTKEHRENLSRSLTGFKRPPMSEEQKKLLSKIHKGKVPWNKGKVGVYNPETLEIMSAHKRGMVSFFKGKKHSPETLQMLSNNKIGTVVSLETRRKLSAKMKQRVLDGKHNLWRGGIMKENDKIRKSLEYKLWRESVFKRDDYTCQECNERGCKLNAHHIKPFAYFPELRFAIDNGVTLCLECHKETPSYLNRWGILKK